MKIMIVTHAEATRETGFQMLSFGMPPDNSDEYVILQIPDDGDEQDKKPDLSRIYLEINDQAHAGYGSIFSIHVGEGIVRIDFDAVQLGLPPDHAPMEIRCIDTTRSFADVRQMLIGTGQTSWVKV